MIACAECNRAFVPEDGDHSGICAQCQAEAVADLVCGDLVDGIDYEDHWDEPQEECDACEGTGWVNLNGTMAAECPECGGDGYT